MLRFVSLSLNRPVAEVQHIVYRGFQGQTPVHAGAESKVLVLTVLVMEDWLDANIIYEDTEGTLRVQTVRRALPTRCVRGELLC